MQGIELAALDREKLLRLRRMKALATGLLLAMTAVFVLTGLTGMGSAWVGYLHAFSEAAMIGALADWFAVTALFRHPLGLPVPHTAIIPRQKDRIGENLARFVKENFLVRGALSPRLESLDFAGTAARWFARRENAVRLTEDAGQFGRWLIGALDDAAVRGFVQENLHLTLAEVRITPLVGRVLELLTRGERYEELIGMIVRSARRELEAHKGVLRQRIGTRTPWWIPKFVDREIYDKIVAELEEMLERFGAEGDHAARRRLNEAIAGFVGALQHDPQFIARGEAIKREVLAHPAVRRYLADIWSQVTAMLAREFRDRHSHIRARLESGIVDFADGLGRNPAMRAQVNQWIRDAVLYVVDHYRDELAGSISDTVAGWDAEATSRRIELQVGRDLQFIRINGTLVGGLVGLVLYATAGWLLP